VVAIKMIIYGIEWIRKNKSFKGRSKSFLSLDKRFIVDGRWLTTLIPKEYAPFWNVAKFEIGGWRLGLYLVLLLWTSSFDLYWSSFFTTTTTEYRENIYCDYKGKIFRFLNRSPQESLFLEFIIIMIFFLLIQKY
jgi:hypothetical protein